MTSRNTKFAISKRISTVTLALDLYFTPLLQKKIIIAFSLLLLYEIVGTGGGMAICLGKEVASAVIEKEIEVLLTRDYRVLGQCIS